MRRDLFLSLFPPPIYLTVPNVGLDISDQSAKFIELLPSDGGISIGRFGELGIPAGVVEAGKIKKPEELSKILTNLKDKYKISRAVVSLPEEQAYTVRSRVPFVNESEIRDSLDLQLVELVPIPAAGAVLDYDIYKRPIDEHGFYDLSVSVVPKEMVESYIDVLTRASLTPIALEIEAQALARTFISKSSEEVTMIVDIGKTRTSISINVGQMVLYTSTISNIGGDNITHSIEKNLQITYEEAERLKIDKGILRSSDNQELFYSLIPVISSLKDEIMKVIVYWTDHHDDNDISVNKKIDRVILCGGQASLPGLDQYISINTGLPTKVGNPWTNVLDFNDSIPDMDFRDSLRYSTAIGLALRTLMPLI